VTRRNLADLVRAAAEAGPATAALLTRDARLTWAELDAAVDACAAGLRALGLEPGDRVGLQLGNVLAFPVAYFGALRAGLVAVPVNPGYTREEVRHLLGDSGARALLAGPQTAGADPGLHADLPALEHVVAVEPGPDVASALPPGEPAPDAGRGGEDLAVVLYTSGTSGRPRGAMLSHRALLANLDQCSRIEPPVVAPGDVVLLVLPLSHVYGLNAGLGMVAARGATGLLVERFDPVETLEQARAAGVTALLGAPPLFLAWSLLPGTADAFRGLRLALSGAAPLPPEVLARVLELTGRPVHEGYGLTETAPVLTTTLRSATAKPGSVGQPVPGVELRLLDEAGRPVEEGDPGEVVVRGANLFSGYWPDGAEGPDADGWWATGDVGLLDAEGDLHLVDRRRELVLVSGFNVYPREVEAVLLEHPAISDAAVLGVPHPYTGESVKAVVVLRPGATLTADEVIAHCAASLARFKCPTAVEFADALPHSATGKVSKGRLRERSEPAL
jgi:long-chain acyl-CoA synthetase